MSKLEELEFDIWKEVSEYSGISGHEENLHKMLEKWLKPYVDTIQYDHLMSLVGTINGEDEGPTIMIVSHIDEVGFQVKEITADGFIYMQPVGGWWAHVLPAQLFQIITKNKQPIIGVIGSRPPHGMSIEEKNTVMKLEELYLDIGVTSKTEVCNLGIEIGNQITPYSSFNIMNNDNFLIGKAWDDRCCMAIELELARRLSLQKQQATIHLVGSAQEEVGQRGARTVANMLHPDISIALDVTNALDTPFERGNVILGKGPVLTIMDASSIAHEKLFAYVENICIEEKIPFQYSCSKSGGTDNGNIHKSLKGIIGMTISLPSRYMHSPQTIIHKKDMLQTIRLLEILCTKLTSADIIEFKNYNR